MVLSHSVLTHFPKECETIYSRGYPDLDSQGSSQFCWVDWIETEQEIRVVQAFYEVAATRIFDQTVWSVDKTGINWRCLIFQNHLRFEQSAHVNPSDLEWTLQKAETQVIESPTPFTLNSAIVWLREKFVNLQEIH